MQGQRSELQQKNGQLQEEMENLQEENRDLKELVNLTEKERNVSLCDCYISLVYMYSIASTSSNTLSRVIKEKRT